MRHFPFAAALMLATLVGCGGSSSGGPATLPDGGALNISGTWTASALTLMYTSPAPAMTTNSTTGQTYTVTQTGSAVNSSYVNNDGTAGTCSGTISGTTVTSSCSITMLAGSTACTASYTRTDTINDTASPMTMTTTYSYTAGGGSACGYSGYQFSLSGTLTFGS